MARPLRPVALLLLASAILPGCSYFLRGPTRPIRSIEHLRVPPARQACLMVFLPGVLDGPETFDRYGFSQEVWESGARCDTLAIDAHASYFGNSGGAGAIEDVVFEDVLTLAELRGYREIWLVGISLGGLAALLTTEKHADLIEGLILLAPVLGSGKVLEEIRDAGGVAAWRPDGEAEGMSPANQTKRLWTWIKAWTRSGETQPRLFLGYGAQDDMAPACDLLAAALPPDRVRSIDGGHRWSTWEPLFRALLAEAQPGRLR